jgi:phytoene dehydrogenase-like protein
MEGFVGAVAEMIEQHKGRILRNQRVVSASASARRVERVKTQTGDSFAADVVVVNFDPKSFLAMLECPGGTGFRRLPEYKYSRSVTSLFLGVTDVRILEPCFGKWNVWYRSGTDLDPRLYDTVPLAEPRLLYLNSPTLVKGINNDSPPGHATLTAFAPCSYQAFNNAEPAVTQVLKDKHASMLTDVIERRFAPGLKEKIGAVYFDTPVDKERLLGAPLGNAYGRPFEPKEVWRKVPFKGVLPNLYFIGAYVSFPGIATVIQGACRLYQELTGDNV